MKTSKKILMLLGTLAVVGIISGSSAWALNVCFHFHFWGMFVLVSLVQLFGNSIQERYVDHNMIKSRLDEIRSKRYKDYLINLMCQHCSHIQPISVDLEDSEFSCANCGRRNGIHTAISTAAVTEIQESIKI